MGIVLSKTENSKDLKCDHDWEYLEAGYNHGGYYWMDKRCKKCGHLETDWVD